MSELDNNLLGYDIANEQYVDINENHTEFMAACGATDIPEIMDPRPWFDILMQAAMSSCVGHGKAGVMQLCYKQATGNKAYFSRMDAYLQAQKFSDLIQPGFRYFGRDGGALVAGARRSSMEHGCCFEADFKYPNGYSTAIPGGETEKAQLFKIQSSSVIKDFDSAKTYLGAGVGGLIVGAPWPFAIGSNSTVNSFRSYGRQGHCWCILGYLKDLLVGVNSHGTGFQDRGFFYLNRQGFNEMAANRAVTVVGLSDLTTPRGRKVDWANESMFA